MTKIFLLLSLFTSSVFGECNFIKINMKYNELLTGGTVLNHKVSGDLTGRNLKRNIEVKSNDGTIFSFNISPQWQNEPTSTNDLTHKITLERQVVVDREPFKVKLDFLLTNSFDQNCQRIPHENDKTITAAEINSYFTEDFIKNFPTYIKPGKSVFLDLDNSIIENYLDEMKDFINKKTSYQSTDGSEKYNIKISLKTVNKKSFSCEVYGKIQYQKTIQENIVATLNIEQKARSCKRAILKVLKNYLQ